MNRSSEPCWMEPMLLLTVPARTRESIAGDLHEEYHGVRLPRTGRLRADLWYAGQVLSFVPHHVAAVFARFPALVLVCGFTGLCGAWLGAAGLRHRHPGHVEGELIAALIVWQAAVSLIALCYRPVTLLRRTALAGILTIVWLALKALVGAFRGAHLEGYVLLIALLLLVQAALTLRSIPAWRSRGAS